MTPDYPPPQPPPQPSPGMPGTPPGMPPEPPRPPSPVRPVLIALGVLTAGAVAAGAVAFAVLSGGPPAPSPSPTDSASASASATAPVAYKMIVASRTGAMVLDGAETDYEPGSRGAERIEARADGRVEKAWTATYKAGTEQTNFVGGMGAFGRPSDLADGLRRDPTTLSTDSFELTGWTGVREVDAGPHGGTAVCGEGRTELKGRLREMAAELAPMMLYIECAWQTEHTYGQLSKIGSTVEEMTGVMKQMREDMEVPR